MEQACRRHISAWKSRFPYYRCAYSYKTNPLKRVTLMLKRAGASAEVVSGMELQWALSDGFLPRDIFFNGPAKTADEISHAVKLGVNLHIDSLDETNEVIRFGKRVKTKLQVLLRATTTRGQTTSRFGMNDRELSISFRRLIASGIGVRGIHFHIGSNLCDPALYIHELFNLFPLLTNLQSANKERPRLSLGGGFPAQSMNGTSGVTPIEDFANAIADAFTSYGLSTDEVELVTEPGRSLVEDFGYLVASVIRQKRRGQVRIAILDAGTNLVRSISHWYHPVEFCRSASHRVTYEIQGHLCFESDVFAVGIRGPRTLNRKDQIIIGSAGGYDIPSANIWGHPEPAILGLGAGGVVMIPRLGRVSTGRHAGL